MIEFFNPTDAPPPGAFSRATHAEYVRHFPKRLPARHTARFGIPTAAKVAFGCIALGPDVGRAR